nr:diguanylate cyclase [Sphingobium sp.]
MSLLRASVTDTPPRSMTLMVALGLAESGTEVSPFWISGAFAHIARLWPLILLAKLCISLLLSLSPLSGGAVQLGIFVAVLAIDAIVMTVPRTVWFQGHKPHLQKRMMLPAVFLSGLTFSLWLSHQPPAATDTLFLAAVPELAVALLAASIFGNRRLLGISYFTGALIVSAIEKAGLAQIGLLMSCVIVMLVAALRQAMHDREHAIEGYRQELRAKRSDRLLQEHERSGRGWFWETDRQGCLTYLSDPLARTLNLSADALIGRPITDIVRPGDKKQGDGERTLGFHLSARTGFSDIPVCAALVKDEERWWSISGQPVFNEYGQFHGFRGSGTDLTEMRRSQAEVTRLAQFDSLTGLANRIQMLRSLEQAVASRHGKPGECALLMLDLDRFKSVN